MAKTEATQVAQTGDSFEPRLVMADWGEEWKLLQKARKHADDATYWDAKAKTFPVKHGSQEGYVARFLDLARISSDDIVLDMGCGTGALATPLAQAGCKVIACDFSQGMLEVMMEDQRQLGIDTVDVRVLSWADDWGAAGLTENCVDVALASRSIATDDLKESLLRLNRVARKRACITLPSSSSPRTDEALMVAAGLKDFVGHDFVYAFNILVQLGLRPEVHYIPNKRIDRFESFDEALEKLTEIVVAGARGRAGQEMIDAVPRNLSAWLADNLVEVDGIYELAKPRDVVWAFISWDTRDEIS